MDARTLSSFGEKEFVFAPYDANQLREILEERAKVGFKEDVLDDAVIPLCAALAAQEHGDARKALMLLRYAGKVSVERGGDRVIESDVREAQQRVESDKIIKTIKTFSYHQKLVLYVIASNDAKEVGTNEIYVQYKTICEADDLAQAKKNDCRNRHRYRNTFCSRHCRDRHVRSKYICSNSTGAGMLFFIFNP